MLTYSFERIGSDTLYEYLYQCIKKDILQKKLLPGERLPSKRSFAKNLNVSVITVENAYAQLMVEGYIYALEKKGYFVADIEKKEVFKRPISQGELERKEEKQPCEIDLVTGRIADENFPFNTWAKLTREVLSTAQCSSLLKKAPTGGDMSLRRAIARHLYAFKAMQIEPEQVIIGAGTEYLYQLIIQLLGRNNVFAVEDPGYTKLAKIYSSQDVACRHIEMDEAGVTLKALDESGADIAHISPSHHYPTGIVMPVSRRYELLGWAALKEKRYIIEDDYDCEYRLSGRPIPAMQSIDVMEKVIYMNTFSKSLAPSFRISYMVLPKHLLKLYNEKLGFYACTVSNVEQFTLARFIEEGYFEKHINRMRNYYRGQRDLMIEEIKKSKVAPYIRIHEEDAGLHFLLEIKKSVEDKELVAKAQQQGLYLSCLSQYYGSDLECKTHEIIVNYAGIQKKQTRGAAIKLCKVIESVLKEK